MALNRSWVSICLLASLCGPAIPGARAANSADVNPGDPCAVAAARKALIEQVSDHRHVPPAEIGLRRFSVNFSWPKEQGVYSVGISMGPLLGGDASIEEGSEYAVAVRPKGKRICEVGKVTRIRRMRFLMSVAAPLQH
jgi:hypothetical protein